MTTYIPSLTLPAFLFEQPAVSILLPLATGSVVGIAVQAKTDKVYRDFKQPPLRPPPWLFGPVWTVLYLMMGYAAHRAWKVGSTSLDPAKFASAKHGATLYTIQLGLNMAFMPLFFGLGRPIEATVDIAALTGTVGYLAYVWSQVDKVSAWCLAPYIAWLSFATYVCAASGYLNDWDFSQYMPGKGEVQKKE